ncbi:MAG: lysine--tRNA ligase [Dehalococcoidia bacterium]|nr:lysine--tRNA ligase [Dehalococcoidia bacterium]
MPGEDELIEARREKLARLRSRGVDPFPPRVDRTHAAADAIAAFERWEQAGRAGQPPEVAVTGRIVALRDMGKASFIDLLDGSGRIQCYLKKDTIGADAYAGIADLDLADFLSVRGALFRTRTQQITVEARSYAVVAKALRPPPEKWHGVEDIETRFRQRYLDLMANEETRELFRRRAAIVARVRRFLDERGFIEVETPVLQPEAGGAAATPFVTHHRALDEDFYLRISLELHLKRLIVGGLDRVYELGRIFRNEGIDRTHVPEFTMIETYEAYADYNDVMRMVEEMVSTVARDVLGTTRVPFGEHVLELAPPWQRLTMRDALIEHAGIDFEEFRTRGKLLDELRRRGIDVDPGWSWGKLIDEAVSVYVEPRLQQPTFLLDYPKEISPLAKSKPGAEGIVERFEVFTAGFELGNAYSELNDAIDQRARFETQARLKAAGIEEVETLDEDFLTALEHGMPPTGGFGMGIDRLVMLLTGQTQMREVILFPQMRRRE